VLLATLYRFPGGIDADRLFTEGAAHWTVGEPPGDIFAMVRESSTPALESAWAFTLRILEHTAALLAAKSVRLGLVIVPAGNQVGEHEWRRGRTVWRLDGPAATRAQAILTAFGRRQGIPTVDLLPALRGSQEFPLYFPYDGHFTAAGHRATAAAIEGFLREQPWFPRS